ncbi:MAG: MBL fold metallo-hydrolase [Thermoplasmata archaeon]
MEVHRIVDPAFDANLYLVKSEDTLLIDSGTGIRSAHILQELREMLGSAPIDRFILTHRHVDHAGGAKAISEAFGIIPWVSVDEAPSLLDGEGGSTGATLFGIRLEPVKVKVIDYGETIDLGDVKLRTLHTPGHTVGSICLLGEDGSLFAGDTLFAYGGIGRWDLETGSLSDLLSSLKLLESLGAEDLYPGHGPAISGEAGEHLSMAIEMAEAFHE